MSQDDEEEDIARIVDGQIQRLRRGEVIDWPAVLRQYPRHAAELQRLAPTMEAMVKVLIEGVNGRPVV